MPGTIPSLPPDAQAYVRQLEVRLEQAEKSLRLLPHQRGAIPGSMRAVQINDPGLAASMWMNLIGNTPGQAPYLAVTDPNGVIRAEMGNLAANGNSPAQEGFRANQADGSPLFDSIGAYGLPRLIGSQQNFSQQSVTGNGSYQTVSGSTVNFTLTQPGNLLVLASGLLLNPTVGDTGYTLQAAVLTDGAYVAANGGQWFNTSTAQVATPITPFAVAIGLAAGNHNFAIGVQQTNTHLWSYVSGYIYVFKFGA